jgi:LacI family transcriptional regulator
MKSISIKDIAEKSNVSITTVSFIINGKAKEKAISDAVIKKVQKIIEESGYKPNQTARSLRTGNSKIIGLIIEDISNSFFSKVARLIEDKAYKRGYKIFYSSTENNLDKAKELIQMFKSRNVDGYIISPIKGIENEIKQLLEDDKPVVLFDRNLADLDTNYVGSDHFIGTYGAIKNFIDKGKKNIALVTIDINVKQISERFEGYKAAILDNNLVFNENLILKIPFNQEETITINQILSLIDNNEIDAILFATNYLTISGLKAFKQKGKILDESLEIIGYDDHEAFELHSPKISAIQQPLEEIAESIIEIMLDQLAPNSKKTSKQVIIPSKLILR